MFVYWCWIALHLTVTNVGFVLRILLFSVLCFADHCLLSNGLLLSLLRFTASDYLFGILLPFSCLSFDLRLLITSLVSCGNCLVSPLIYGFWLPLWYLVAIVLSLLRFTASDYLFIILWPLSCLSLDLRRLITSLVSFGHCLVSHLNLFGILLPLSCLSFDLRLLIISLVSCGHFPVSPLIYGFWLPLWYLQTFLANMLFVKRFIC